MRLLLISTIMTVLSHLTGSILRDYEAIKTMLKSEMIILLDDFPQKRFVILIYLFSKTKVFLCRKLRDVLISISEQVVKTTREELTKYDKAKIIIDNEQNIKDAIQAIGEHHVIEHAVFKLLCK
jgi:predicted membrane channel-forming protein YqfA (hemolysin III family)